MMLSALLVSAVEPDGKWLGHLRPRHATEVKNSSWGVNYFGYAPDYPQEMLLDRLAALGVKWVRMGARWSEVEKERGRYDWTAADQLLGGAVKRGLIPIVSIYGGNELYTEQVSGSPPIRSEEAWQAWSAYVKALAERYHRQIKHWEIWNEPTQAAFWLPKPDPIEYARLLRQASSIIKDVDPQAVIVGGVLAGPNVKFTEGFMGYGGAASSLDKLSFHVYGNVPEDRLEEILQLKQTVHRLNPKVALWQNEAGHPSSSDSAHLRLASPWGLNIQAKWLLRRLLTDRLAGVEMSAYFMLVELNYSAEAVAKGRVHSVPPSLVWSDELKRLLGEPPEPKFVGTNTKGLIRFGSWTPKPAYFACQNIAALIDGRYELVRLGTEFKVQDPGVFSGLGTGDTRYPMVPMAAAFRAPDGQTVLTYWLPWQPQELVRPAKIELRVAGAVWREPVWIDLLEGQVYAPGRVEREGETTILRNLPLADYPIALAERAAVEIIPDRDFQ